jgi:hypothetical protein
LKENATDVQVVSFVCIAKRICIMLGMKDLMQGLQKAGITNERF